nr:MAG TPA: Homodimerization region of STAR domain protein [Caudoviricetes sp.]
MGIFRLLNSEILRVSKPLKSQEFQMCAIYSPRALSMSLPSPLALPSMTKA